MITPKRAAEIIAESKVYKYTSLMYNEPDTIVCFKELSKNPIILGAELNGRTHIHWALDDVETLIAAVKPLFDKKPLIEYVPPTFVNPLENAGFTISGRFLDFFNNDISALNLDDCQTHLFLKKSECGRASEISGEPARWFLNWLNGANNAILVARTGQEVVGFSCVALCEFLWIRLLYVDKEYRNKGVGSALTRHSLAYGLQKGANRAFLGCEAGNASAISIYEKYGFARTGDNSISMLMR